MPRSAVALLRARGLRAEEALRAELPRRSRASPSASPRRRRPPHGGTVLEIGARPRRADRAAARDARHAWSPSSAIATCSCPSCERAPASCARPATSDAARGRRARGRLGRRAARAARRRARSPATCRTCITGRFLERATRGRATTSTRAVFMVQLEVAERLVGRRRLEDVRRAHRLRCGAPFAVERAADRRARARSTRAPTSTRRWSCSRRAAARRAEETEPFRARGARGVRNASQDAAQRVEGSQRRHRSRSRGGGHRSRATRRDAQRG